MPRNVATVVENNFTSGLITEATALNFPENAVTDTYDCIFDEKGKVSRRLGFDFETDYETKAVVKTNKAIREYLWENAAGTSDFNFVVVQIGSTLYFYRTEADTALSGGILASTISITPFVIGGAPAEGTEECSFAAGKGYLFVTHPYCDPFYVTYTSATNVFSATRIIVRIRDTVGVDDGLDVDENPTTLSDLHKYNLWNQGWEAKPSVPSNGRVDGYRNTWSKYPSNAEVWWLYKDLEDNFNPRLAASHSRGTSRAPKGSIILGPFHQDRSAATGIPNIPVTSAGYQRPSTTAFYAGRVFYSGVKGQSYVDKIYFSQIIESPSQFGECFQQNDPSSEFAFDLLASDGGLIDLPGSGEIIKLHAIEGHLLVFTKTGIWSITGSTGVGFTAVDYTVRQISSISALSHTSFVDVKGFPVWWNLDGIYTLTVQGALGQVSVVPLSEKKIDDFYDLIPLESKRYAKGAYNSRENTIQYLYRSTAPTDVEERYEYDRVLNANALSTAFYPWTISASTLKINGIVAMQGVGSTLTTSNVTDEDGATVTDGTGVAVTVTSSVTQALTSTTKFLCSSPSGSDYLFTFAENKDDTYVDWETFGTGINYDSYFVTGYKVHGDAQRKFQSNYVYVYADHEEPSKFYFQGIWNYATSGNTGRYSSRQYIQMDAGNYGYRWKRIKVRGHGISLQFKVTSEDGEPFDLVGWTVFETGNALP
jgi:hypothetical protein